MIIYNELNYQFEFDLNKLFTSILNTVINVTKKKFKDFYVNLVDNHEIKDINNKYRNKNKITDVITFRFADNNMYNPIDGEIYICIPQAIKQAKQYQHSIKREIAFLFTHALLHLQGYDHLNEDDEKIMFELQDKVLQTLNINR